MSKRVVGHLKETGSQLDFEWEIPDFLSLSTEVDEGYESPVYVFGDTAWYIHVFPNGEKRHSSKGYIGVYVCRGDAGPPRDVTYCLFLKMTDGRKKMCNEQKDTFKCKDDKWGRSKALKRSELIQQESKFLPSGALRVICTLKFDEEREVKADEMLRKALKDCTERAEAYTQTKTENGFEERGQLAAAVPEKKFVCDYKQLLLSGDGCDVTLQVKGQKFEAHRTILRARSSVFASMLRHDMKEKNTGLIDIEDCDPETFPDFLRFLYCGNVHSITSQNARSLYKAADKYDVQDLKSECLVFIKNHLDVDHFCDVITLALQHREVGLVQQATDFFVENSLKIVKTVKWQIFLDENSTEGNELIIKALSANESSNP